MDTGYSKWRKLDNAALAFPLVTGKDDTRVFRFYCQLKEKVDGEILQSALDQAMEKYPLFQAVLRKGLFWFYLEHRSLRAVVKQETEPPCSRLYIPDKKSLLFQVSYDKNRINFEVFHALTDGTGAMHFLQELVQNYLILAHPESNLPRIENAEEITHGDKEEDSFSQYYSSDIPKDKEKKKAAVKLKGEKLVHSDMHITEVVLSVKDIHQRARSYGVSITILLTAMMLVLGFIESLLPVATAVPGVKLGLSNGVLMFALYMLDAPTAFLLMLLKVVLSGLLFGGVSAMMYAMAGGVASMLVMILQFFHAVCQHAGRGGA